MNSNVPLIFEERQKSEGFWGNILGAAIGVLLGAAGFLIGVGATGLAGDTTSFWILSRSAGVIAYLLLWGSVVWGLLLSGKIGRKKLAPAIVLDAHQFISNAAIGFAAFHGLILMGDRYVSFPLMAVLIPFVGTYKPILVAAGQIGFWLSLALSISFLVRKRIGPKAWRTFHYVSFLTYWGVWLHSILIGTDIAFAPLKLFYFVSSAAVTLLTIYRIFAARPHAARAALPAA